MTRPYLSGEYLSQALLDAGIDVTPETALAVNFNEAAAQLDRHLKYEISKRLDEFSDTCLY